CWVSGGWEMPSRWAARVKLSSSATARKYLRWRSSMTILFAYGDAIFKVFSLVSGAVYSAGHDAHRRAGHDGAEAEEIRRALRRRCRQYGALHRGPHRQRSAVSRIRQPRDRNDLRVRGDRAPPDPREAPDPQRACRLQEQAQGIARPAR